jgi:RNA polymerase sigma factor (sigma-70 family)
MAIAEMAIFRMPASRRRPLGGYTQMMETPPKLGLPPPFEQAMCLHEREIMRYIVRTIGDQEDALEIFQETWLRAYRAYRQLDSADGLRPWLFRIATNLCLNRKRDRMRQRRVIMDDPIQPEDSDATYPAHEATLHLKSLISKLPNKQRRALVMRKLGGLEYGEIAAALGCSEESARAGVYQALKKLKAAE